MWSAGHHMPLGDCRETSIRDVRGRPLPSTTLAKSSNESMASLVSRHVAALFPRCQDTKNQRRLNVRLCGVHNGEE